jgi:hypothetical protein
MTRPSDVHESGGTPAKGAIVLCGLLVGRDQVQAASIFGRDHAVALNLVGACVLLGDGPYFLEVNRG